MKQIRKWDSDFFNFNNLNYPQPSNVTHRLMTNIIYYNQNYSLLFIFIFLTIWYFSPYSNLISHHILVYSVGSCSSWALSL